MEIQNIKFIAIAILGLSFAACSNQASKAQTTTEEQERQGPPPDGQRGERPGGREGGPPDFASILSEMDANEDGKLSKAEVKGRLKNDFAKIDADEDGFISEAEFKSNAPKPPRRN